MHAPSAVGSAPYNRRPKAVLQLAIRGALDSVVVSRLFGYLTKFGMPRKFVAIQKVLKTRTSDDLRVFVQLSSLFT